MHQPEPHRPRTFFPTAITTFRNCPERYYHQYIRKLKRPVSFSRPLVVGGATHRLIARALPLYFQTGEVALDLGSEAMQQVSTSDYPEEELPYREQDARDVVEMTRTAIELVPSDARSLLQERKLFAPVGRRSIQIGAQVDLVMERSDGAIEHVDFKTGKVRDNTVQSLMARTVVGRRYQAASEIHTTTIHLAHHKRDTNRLTSEGCRDDWREIARNIQDIRSFEHFAPYPGPLCDYCPYQACDCSVM